MIGNKKKHTHTHTNKQEKYRQKGECKKEILLREKKNIIVASGEKTKHTREEMKVSKSHNTK